CFHSSSGASPSTLKGRSLSGFLKKPFGFFSKRTGRRSPTRSLLRPRDSARAQAGSLLHEEASDGQTIKSRAIETAYRFSRTRDRRLAKQVERGIEQNRHAGYFAKLHKQLPKRSVSFLTDGLDARKTVAKHRGGDQAAAALLYSAHT